MPFGTAFGFPYSLLYGGGSGGGAPVTAPTWDPDNSSSSYTLSESNYLATNTDNSAESALGYPSDESSDKVYFELELDAWPTGSTALRLGLIDSAEGNATDPGAGGTLGIHIQQSRVVEKNGTFAADYGDNLAAGDTFGFAWDKLTGKLWIRDNGVWLNSGDPVAGTGEVGTLDAPVGEYVPVFTEHSGPGAATRIRTQEANFLYTPPTGFDAYYAPSDTRLPSVTLSTDKTVVPDNGDTAVVTATLDKTWAEDVVVNLAFSGDAVGGGTDYTASSNTITITAGTLSNSIDIIATYDETPDSDKTLIIDVDTITEGTENNEQQVTITIQNDDLAATAWDRSYSGANVTFSEGDQVAQGNNHSTRSLIERTSGKWYFEVQVNGGTTPNHWVGVCRRAADFTDEWFGAFDSVYGWGYRLSTRRSYHNSNFTDHGSGSFVADGNVVGVALDLGTGNIWFSENGSFVSGSPALGTGAQFNNATGNALAPAFGSTFAGTGKLLERGADLIYSPPVGFNPWAGVGT